MEALLAQCSKEEFAELVRLVAAKQQALATEQPAPAAPSAPSVPSPAPAPALDTQASGEELEEGEVGSPSEPSTPPAYLSFSQMSPTTRARQKQALLSGQFLMLGDGYDADAISKDAGSLQFETHRRAFASMMDSFRPRKTVQPTQPSSTASAQPPSDRAQYLAKLQAAKNKKTEIPKAPVPTPVAANAPKAKKAVDPKKNELLRQKLAALKAEQAAPRQGLGTGLSAAPATASDPAALLAALTPGLDASSQPNDFTSSGRSSVASAMLSSQKRPPHEELDSANASPGRPFDRGAYDYQRQQVVIQVSDESESELDDESDYGVDLQLDQDDVSRPSSAVDPPRVATPGSLAYAKKLQEIEIAKRKIAAREEQARLRTNGLATPSAEPQPAFAVPTGTGGIPGITNAGQTDDAAAQNTTTSEVDVDGADVEDDQDFDDIYDTGDADINDAPEGSRDTGGNANAAPLINSAIIATDDNIDTEMEDTEDFYDDAGTEDAADQKQPASLALVDAVRSDLGFEAPAASETPTAALHSDFNSDEGEMVAQDEDDMHIAPQLGDERDFGSAPAEATAVASQQSSVDETDDSDASMDMSDSQEDSDENQGHTQAALASPDRARSASSDLHMSNTDREEAAETATTDSVPNTTKAKWVAKSVFKPYESPFNAYRPQAETQSAHLDPQNPLCPAETSGLQCTDKDCDFQHFKDMALGGAY